MGNGYERMTGGPPRRGLLAGLVDRFEALPTGARLFIALLALMGVFALFASQA